LGHHAPKAGIGTFLNDTKANFNELIADTDVRGLRFIPGDTEIPGTANLKSHQLKSLVRRFLALKDETDILIMDLGAGTHQSILDFFLLSTKGIVVSAPTVTAVLNAYVFLKNTVFRLMHTVFGRGSPAAAYLEKARKDGSGGPQRLYIPKMLPEIENIDPESHKKFIDRISHFHPRLIMNMIDDPKDSDVAMKIRRSCEEYLALKIEHLGVVYRDNLQDTALSSRLPIVLYKPQSVLSQAIYRIADKILQSEEDSYGLNEKQIEESFQEAGLEAEVDFNAKMEYVEDLLHSGALSQADLVETVKSQQLEIAKIKKENNFLKLKLSNAMAAGFTP
jgi:flagellar biosynthesis protein FlhG